MWEPLAIEPCYYVPVTSMISGVIVGSAAQYMWHFYRTIQVEAEHQVFQHCIIKSDLFIEGLNGIFTVSVKLVKHFS